jgi:hypothetical protein
LVNTMFTVLTDPGAVSSTCACSVVEFVLDSPSHSLLSLYSTYMCAFLAILYKPSLAFKRVLRNEAPAHKITAEEYRGWYEDK